MDSITQSNEDLRHNYLELLKKVLTFSYGGENYIPVNINKFHRTKRFFYQLLSDYLSKRRIYLLQNRAFDPKLREEGKDHPISAFTMIGMKRLSNIQSCIEDIILRNVPGDLIETGVWRGGAVILMRAVLQAYNVKNKKVWVADSFEGLPAPNPDKYPEDKDSKYHLMDDLAVSLEQVKQNFQMFELLDEQVCFLKGWFKDTLPTAPIKNLSLIRLDGDMYESTMDALANLYPKLSPGGYVIVDDYWDIKSCKIAVDEYRKRNSIDEEIITVDWTGIYWVKNG